MVGDHRLCRAVSSASKNLVAIMGIILLGSGAFVERAEAAVDGPQATIAILAELPGETPAASVEEIEDAIEDANPYFLEFSYGSVWLDAEVVGPYTIQSSHPGDAQDEALDAAAADGVDFHEVDRILLYGGTFTNANNTCGRTSLLIHAPEGDYWILASINVPGLTVASFLHEVGHGFGIHEAWHESSIDGELVKYGNSTDAMGAGGGGHYNAGYKTRLGWIDPQLISESGTYVLSPLELEAPPGGALALKAGIYYFEYRQPIGYDVGLDDNWNSTDGALVNRVPSVRCPHGASLDMTPETPAGGSADMALMVGRTAAVRYLSTDYHVTPVSKTEGENGELTLEAHVGSFPGNQDPVVQGIDVQAVELPDGRQEVTFTANAFDPDEDALAFFWNFEVGYGARHTSEFYLPGTYGSGSLVTHVFEGDTPRMVTAIVSDMKGGEAKAGVDLFGHMNTAPQINSIEFSFHDWPDCVRVFASVEDDEDDLLFYDWEIDHAGGQTSVYRTPSFCRAPPMGTLVTLTVTDGDLTTSLTQAIANVAPVADIDPATMRVLPGQLRTLDGSGSYDPDGPEGELLYEWTKHDGTVLPLSEEPTLAFTAPTEDGVYVYELHVTDGLDWSDAATCTVRVVTPVRH